MKKVLLGLFMDPEDSHWPSPPALQEALYRRQPQIQTLNRHTHFLFLGSGLAGGMVPVSHGRTPVRDVCLWLRTLFPGLCLTNSSAQM